MKSSKKNLPDWRVCAGGGGTIGRTVIWREEYNPTGIKNLMKPRTLDNWKWSRYTSQNILIWASKTLFIFVENSLMHGEVTKLNNYPVL